MIGFGPLYIGCGDLAPRGLIPQIELDLLNTFFQRLERDILALWLIVGI
jgi:hypothetical protein